MEPRDEPSAEWEPGPAAVTTLKGSAASAPLVSRLEIERLVRLTEEELCRELGARHRVLLVGGRDGLVALAVHPASAGAAWVRASPPADGDSSLEDVGRAFWRRSRGLVAAFVCDPGSPHAPGFGAALEQGAGVFGARLAHLLAEEMGMLPAFATVVASLAARIAMEDGLEALCRVLRTE